MKKYCTKIKHLLEYVTFLIVVRLLKSIGIDRSANICSILARFIGPFLPVTKIARKNLQNVFGMEVNHEKIIDGLWDNFGRFIGEFPYLNNMTQQEIDQRVEIIGIEHLEEFKRLNQPFLLFSGHFANWDFALKLANRFYHKFGIVYRKANNPYIDKIINNFRSNSNISLIVKGPNGGKDLIKSIKAGHAIAMLVDQKMNDGIKVPFFGKPAMTPHAIAKFAIQFHYPIVPCQVIRTQGSYFKVIIHPPLVFQQTKDNNLDCYNILLKINQILESWIIEYPKQWLWFHNRWGK
jgi:KDO2-lipid IV(A) lauroyltransferase